MVLLQGPKGVRFLMSEVPLYAPPKGLRSQEWYLMLPRNCPLPKKVWEVAETDAPTGASRS
jgi:hypothetical protein